MSQSQHHLLHLQQHASGDLPFSRPHTPHKDVVLGFCGLGAMGYPMARNLANHMTKSSPQTPLHVWNRTRSQSERLEQELGSSKIKIADSPEDLALQCDIIITTLASDDVVRQIFERFVSALKVRVHLDARSLAFRLKVSFVRLPPIQRARSLWKRALCTLTWQVHR